MPSRTVRIAAHNSGLAGELIVPRTTNRAPAVVMLHGAAWGRRRFYGAFADAFSAAGIASLIYDRRGEGESTGDRTLDLSVLADDAIAAYEFLQRQPEVDPKRVGLWGYSNGAWVATLASIQAQSLAFLVLAGASGVSPAVSEIYRRTEDLRRQGIRKMTLEAVERAWTIVFSCLVDGVWESGWDAEIVRLAERIKKDPQLAALRVPDFVRDRPELDSVPRFDSPLFKNLKTRSKGSAAHMGYDPIPSLARVRCPILIVEAEGDANVPVPQSLARFAALAANPNVNLTVEVIPGTDHLFSKDQLSERSNPEVLLEPRTAAQFTDGYLSLMTNWMAEQVRGRQPDGR
jgi:dienelactone hydrolase